MVITSENKKTAYRGYGNTQFHYAMTYVVITFFVLLFLNIYCSRISQRVFYLNKESSMLEKCQLTASEITKLDVVNPATVYNQIEKMDGIKVTRMIITDQNGMALYDTGDTAMGTYVLLPEVMQAMKGTGNYVFSWRFHDGIIDSRAATPIVYYGTIIGCVYITEYDAFQGSLISSLQKNVLQITLILEILVVLFSLFFASIFSYRIRKIMQSMHIIQNGDYTHKVNMGGNDELTILGNEFNDLTERLNTSEQKRRRFVSDASHELKTPLASIKLLTDSILQNDMDMETVREFVGDIGNEADRLNRMTAKLLSLTKLDVQNIAESEIIYIAPTIHRVTRMLSPMAQTVDITLNLNLVNDCPILILEDDLYQIIFNLMENGIKYTPPGGSVYVSLKKIEENAVLTVKDTGVGIPEDAIPHIFERFYRVDKARSRATGGSGLGLAIVRAIVERNRGEISVDSVPGQGTTFTVIFPAFDTEVDKE